MIQDVVQEGVGVLDRQHDGALFGVWLQRRRRQLEMTQAELAASVVCSVATIRKLESDQRHPSERLAAKLAVVLEIAEPERAAFVRFARQGWSERPPQRPSRPTERPWLAPDRSGRRAAPRLEKEPPAVEPSAAATERAGLRSLPRLPEATLYPPRCVGREEIWERMERAWRDGRSIVLTGPGGVGKTRLLQDFARSKGSYLGMAGYPGDAVLPYSTLRRAVRTFFDVVPGAMGELAAWVKLELARFLPEISPAPASAIDGDADRGRFFEAVLQFNVAAARHFATVTADDLHLFDRSSFEVQGWVVSEVVRRRDPSIGRNINAVRPGELPPDYRAALERLVRGGVSELIEVPPLRPGDVPALLVALEVPFGALDPRTVFELTGGNPLRILEAVKGWWETRRLPESPPVDDGLAAAAVRTVRDRLEDLAAGDLRVAQGLALLEEDAGVETLAALAGEPVEQIEASLGRLEALNLVRSMRFVHQLLAEEAMATMPGSLRQILHERAARALERQGAEPARIAHHFVEAGRPTEAVKHRLEAAERALRQGSRIEALGWLSWVVQHAGADGRAAVEAGVLLGETLLGSDVPAARDALEGAREGARQGALPALEAQAVADLARAAVLLGNETAARGYDREASEMLGALRPPERARVLLALSEVRWSLREVGETEASLAEVVRLDPGRPSRRMILTRLFWRTGRFEAVVEELQNVLQSDPNAAGQTAAMHELGQACLALGRLEPAQHWLERALDVWADSGHLLMEGGIRETLGVLNAARGALLEADGELVRAAALFRRQGAPVRWRIVAAKRAYVRLLAGQPEAACRLVNAAQPQAGPVSGQRPTRELVAVSAVAEARAGRGSQARAAAEEAQRLAEDSEHALARVTLLRTQAEVHAALGEHRPLKRAATQLLELTGSIGMREQEAWAHVLLASGSASSAARRHATVALQTAEREGMGAVELWAAERLAQLGVAGMRERVAERRAGFRDFPESPMPPLPQPPFS